MDKLPLTPDEVEERARRYQELLARERELHENLIALKISGDRAQVREKLRQHDAMLAEIRKNRMEGMLPIIVELQAYVRAARAARAGREKEGRASR